jgi:anti-anti-sigma regulatory factor
MRRRCGQACSGLAIVIEHHDERTVLRLQGELDAGNWDRLRQAIDSALECRPQTLLIDFSAV